MAPDQASSPLQCLIVDNVEGHDRAPLRQFGFEPRLPRPALHGDEINKPNRPSGLLPDVHTDVCLVHWGDGMPLHDGMAIKAKVATLIGSKEIAKGLIASDPGRRDDERLPMCGTGVFAKNGDADINGAANGTHRRRNRKSNRLCSD